MSKQEILSLISALPDNVSFEDVLYRLYLMNNIKAGMDDIDAGHAFTQDEVKKLFA
jgi:predicted transcriptional regulator